MNRLFLFAVALAGVLNGCGGDDGGGAPAPAPAPPPVTVGPSPTCTGTESFSVAADATVAVGRTAGAVVAGCDGPLRDVVWSQTAGPPVTLLSARTQAISFDPPAAGAYTFSVSFVDAGGTARSATATIDATGTSAQVVARSDQAVRAGGKVSLRAWPAAAGLQSLSWSQLAGPAVALDTSDPNRILFTAPAVTRDTALVFRVTQTTGTAQTGFTTDSDDVYVLVENYAQAPSDPSNTGPYVFSDQHVSRVHPYRVGGPYAAALVRCTYEANLQYIGAGANTCPLSVLPFLHQTTGGAVPTVAQIMDRVAVSHDWMGQVFEEFLATQASDDMKRLFNGVTAIVIGAHVRPSFYYALTGAIYLDADNFWLTAEQRDVIDETPDFRSDFDRDLMYSSAWRYTEGNASIFVNFPATSRIARSQDYLLAESGWLLYHELAHASDFLPPSLRGTLNNALSPWGNIGPWFQSGTTLPSDQLNSALPLQSAEMRGLAQVKFLGATATAAQRSYTPDTVAGFFSADRASDEYNYSTTREDLAMLFEEFMMFRNHGWRRDMAFTDKITAATSSADLIVRWGQRGRIGDVAVKPRAQLVVGALAPWVASAEVQSLPPPIAMRPGESWTANLVLPAPPAGVAVTQSLRARIDEPLPRQRLHGTPNERWLRRFAR